MKLVLKRDEAGKWAIVEKMSTYYYADNLTVSFIFDLFSKPYIYKGGFFRGLEEIPQEVGISGYIKAKKPFYSVLSKGENRCLVKLTVKYTNNVLTERSLVLLNPIGTTGSSSDNLEVVETRIKREDLLNIVDKFILKEFTEPQEIRKFLLEQRSI